MPRLDHHTLINLGRRAGLKTSELYSALASCRLTAHQVRAGSTDGNGFVPGYDAAGNQIYEPRNRGRNG
jgi:hypothetical protein